MSIQLPDNPHSREPSLSLSLQSTSKQASASRSTIRPVVTSPPWAKDEPDSPQDETQAASAIFDRTRPSGSPTAGIAPTVSDLSLGHGSSLNSNHLWKFLLPHVKLSRQSNSSSSVDLNNINIANNKHNTDDSPSSSVPNRPILPRLINSTKRFSRSPNVSEEPTTVTTATLTTTTTSGSTSREGRSALRLELPVPPEPPFTVSHTKTPGWDTPWTPRAQNNPFTRRDDLENNAPYMSRTKENGEDHHIDRSHSKPLRKRIRHYLLHNNSVPLVSRIINISFTTVALAFAIRIRIVEEKNRLLGAVGSSPFLAIIFAPLTLIHVMVAIYFEYFGRPLGLWRTSAKLAYTLLEVLFICAWSAELALSFDNYLTSRLNCTPPSSVSWFSELPSLPSLFGDNPSPEMLKIADHLCDYQRTLIGVVMVALVFYVTNLVISLFRIFEKVKVGQGWGSL